MDTNLRELERSEPSPCDFKTLVKGITKDSVRKRLSYTPQFKCDELILQVYADGISYPSSVRVS